MRLLLRKYRLGTLVDGEREELEAWLKQVSRDLEVESAERSAALQLLTGFETERQRKLLARKRHWWNFA